MRPLLARVAELGIRFPGAAEAAVDGVSFEIRAGELVALVGESGSGKSLTARALLGLLPREAEVTHQGFEVVGVDGELASAPRPGASTWSRLRGQWLALVPQDALGGLDPLRRVEHEVGDALRLHGLAAGAERRARVIEALTAAGMPDPERRLRQRADELSGGLRQRALVAAALIAGPEIIVADEPTSALDAGHRGRVLRALRERVEAGAGALVISHDLASVAEVADRVLVMRAGRLVESGTAATVLGAPRHPFTRELLAASPAGVARGVPLLGGSRAAAAGARTGATGVAERSPRLRLEAVSVWFGGQRVLDDVTFEVRAGETVGLVGESGSGKTTLLRVALGLQASDQGTVRIDGVDRAALPAAARRALRRRLALVPQDPLDSFPRGASGGAILRDALRAAGVARAHRAARVADLAREVHLPLDALARPAASLSGGQRQRLAIARALARRPEVLLLDEPVSALDLTVQARVLDLLDEVQARHGTAFVFVSHDRAVIHHMSDRVLRLAGGHLEPDYTRASAQQ